MKMGINTPHPVTGKYTPQNTSGLLFELTSGSKRLLIERIMAYPAAYRPTEAYLWGLSFNALSGLYDQLRKISNPFNRMED